MMNALFRDLQRWVSTTKWSIEGWITAWRDEKSLRQWVAVNAISWVILVFVGFSSVEVALLVILGVLVVIVELLNSAIETSVDYVSTDRHPLAKKAKDIASAAVFVAALLWLAVWMLLLVG